MGKKIPLNKFFNLRINKNKFSFGNNEKKNNLLFVNNIVFQIIVLYNVVGKEMRSVKGLNICMLPTLSHPSFPSHRDVISTIIVAPDTTEWT
jgi:hypothetical protein